MRVKLPIIALALIMLVQIPLSQGSDSEVATISPIDDPEMPPIGFYRGILPNNASGEDLADLYEKESQYNQFVPVWGRPTPFYDMPEDLGGQWGGLFVDSLIRGNGMFPLIHINFHGTGMELVSPSNISSPTLNNTRWRNLYRSSVMEALNASKPAYISVGNEVNRWIPKWGMNGSDNGFENYISLYNEIYDEIKARSPNTKVFCTFAREDVSSNSEYNLSFLNKFDPDRLDLLVFTSYPYAVAGVNSPDDLPDDYYTRAFDYIEEMPLGFSEVAWPSLEFFGGQQGQVEFINHTVNRLTRDRGADLELISWFWLTDQSPVTAIGLREADGTEKASYEAWKMNQKPEVIPGSLMIDLEEDFGEYVYDLNNTFRDPDDWDLLGFEIWNGSAYSNITEIKRTSLIQGEINGHHLHLRSLENLSGVTEIRVRASDWFGETKTTLMRITVDEINDPPALIGSTVMDPIPEDRYHITSLSIYITDVDDEIEDLNVTVLDSPDLDVVVNPPDLRFYSMESDWFGQTYILMNAMDPEGGNLTFNLTVTITPVNDKPRILAPKSLNMKEDQKRTFDLHLWEFDKDDEILNWSVKGYLESAITPNITGSNLTITPKRNYNGEAFLDLELSDGEYNVSKRISVEIESVNDPPTIDPPQKLTMREDRVAYFNLTAMGAEDADGDTIIWEVLGYDPIFRAVSFPLNDTIRIAPSLDSTGTGNVYFRMSDVSGDFNNVTLNITVLPINDPPFMTIPENWTYIMEPGDAQTVNLLELDLNLYDVESNLTDLTLFTTSSYCTVDGLTMVIELPDDIVTDRFQVTFEVIDPEGASTGPVVIDIIVERDDTEEKGLDITSYEISTPNGKIILRANGEPGQDIYVVFSDGSCAKMEEIPSGSGKYELTYSNDEWEDGDEFTFYFSSTFKGENDSQWSGTGFTYRDEPLEGDDYTVIYIVAGTMALIGLALLLFSFYRRSRGSVEEFDYESIME